jgi:hypothetical protein
MAVLQVSRPYDGGASLRRLFVEVDGREVAWLKQGQSVDLQVDPGSHSVVGHMDWTSSPVLELDVSDGERVAVEVAFPFSVLWNMILRPKSALSIRRLSHAHQAQDDASGPIGSMRRDRKPYSGPGAGPLLLS